MSINEAEKTNLSDIVILQEVHELREHKREYEMYLKIWLSSVVSSMKQNGNKNERVYKKFTDFYKKAEVTYEFENEKLNKKINKNKNKVNNNLNSIYEKIREFKKLKKGGVNS